MDAGGGSIYEVKDSGLHLIDSLDAGHAAAFLSFPLPGNSVFAKVLAGREPVLVAGITTSDLQPSGFGRYGDDSCLIFPLIDREGSPIAIISPHDKRTPPFVVQDREIGAILASHVSEALQTARAVAALQLSEELMLQAQKMEAIGTLAGGIAHDFNNILSAIVGYPDLSLFVESCPEDVRHNLEQIRKGSMRARDLVRQILSFSRTDEHPEGPVSSASNFPG